MIQTSEARRREELDRICKDLRHLPVLSFEISASLLHAAASSMRSSSVLRPVPPSFKDEVPSVLTSAIDSLPPFQEMENASAPKANELIPFIRDLAVRVVPLPAPEAAAFAAAHLPDVPSILRPRHIFRASLTRDTNANTKDFAEAAAKYGTCLAFHGSDCANWHSIIHTGIRNMSDTSRQAHGAAFGAGVYFSSSLTVARDFASSAAGWRKAHVLGVSPQVVGLFEVVLSPDVVFGAKLQRAVEAGRAKVGVTARAVPSSDTPPTYLIVPNPTHVALRHILVFSLPCPKVRPTPAPASAGTGPTETEDGSDTTNMEHPVAAGVISVRKSTLVTTAGYAMVVVVLALWLMWTAAAPERQGYALYVLRMARRRWIEG
eukprot:TRINITY_DN72234_c0_g1_i1.p1 TRINITY_DN72234_c0_g1~~TRINITY_DN72234_c0_g1_i1.p1  ORF type:complete len:376 (-),score=46.34 TRINITY_DN72234_c0_g1_i1:107-1234(-)